MGSQLIDKLIIIEGQEHRIFWVQPTGNPPNFKHSRELFTKKPAIN